MGDALLEAGTQAVFKRFELDPAPAPSTHRSSSVSTKVRSAPQSAWGARSLRLAPAVTYSLPGLVFGGSGRSSLWVGLQYLVIQALGVGH